MDARRELLHRLALCCVVLIEVLYDRFRTKADPSSASRANEYPKISIDNQAEFPEEAVNVRRKFDGCA